MFDPRLATYGDPHPLGQHGHPGSPDGLVAMLDALLDTQAVTHNLVWELLDRLTPILRAHRPTGFTPVQSLPYLLGGSPTQDQAQAALDAETALQQALLTVMDRIAL